MSPNWFGSLNLGDLFNGNGYEQCNVICITSSNTEDMIQR